MTKSTPLIAATYTGRLDIVKLLVSKGASWKVANKVSVPIPIAWT